MEKWTRTWKSWDQFQNFLDSSLRTHDTRPKTYLCGGPHHKDHSIWGLYWGPLILGAFFVNWFRRVLATNRLFRVKALAECGSGLDNPTRHAVLRHCLGLPVP